MDILTIALLLGAAGVGGAVGAAAAAIVAGNRVSSSFADFETLFTAYFDSREDPDSRRMRSAFGLLKDTLAGMSAAFARLKKTMRNR